MKVISKRDGDLLSKFDHFIEIDSPTADRVANLPSQIRDTILQKLLINNLTDVNKDKMKGYFFWKVSLLCAVVLKR